MHFRIQIKNATIVNEGRKFLDVVRDKGRSQF